MVHVTDDGIFDASLEKIWRFIADDREGVHDHKSIASSKVLKQEGNILVQEIERRDPDGRSTHMETWKFTMNPPKGFEMEALAGPTKGTKYTHTYTSMGDKTRVDVSGDFHVAGLNDASTKKAALAMLEEFFNEDNANLKRYQ